jgi:6-phosphogluconolactonase
VSEVLVVSDGAAAAQAAAELFVESVAGAAAARGRALVALTGGSSAAPLYAALREDPWRARVPWERLEIFCGDERCVEVSDPRSNYGLAARELFSRTPVDASRLHRMRGEASDLEEEAKRAEAELRDVAGHPCRLDLMLLGLGPDGHVLSLFAGVESSSLRGDAKLVWAVDAPRALEPHVPRLTFSPTMLVTARTVVLQASGAAKADALARALRGPDDLVGCPAQWLRHASGRVVVVADSAAAAKLA